MELKLSGLNVGIKGARGLFYQGLAYALRPETLLVKAIAIAGEGFVKLKPGEETEVPVVLPDLTPNTDVKTISATLHVADDTSTVEPEQTTVSIQQGSAAKETFRLEMEMPTRPRNVELKLDQGEVFWTFAGTLAKDSYDLPDFAEPVNAYLDKLEPESNQITLRFLVKSDTRGKVKIAITQKELSRLQTQTWDNPLDDTIRLDRNFQLDYGMIEQVPLDGILDQNKNLLSPDRIRMDIGGEIGQERTFGSIAAHDGKELATISNDYSVAQSFRLDTSIRCVGVSGFFQTEAEAELYLELQNDMNEAPAAGPPLTKSNLTLAPAAANGKKPWTYAGFENPVDLNAQTLYWIVMKAARGRAKAGLQSRTEEYLQHVLVNRGGRLWKRVADSAIAVLLRLVYLPKIDNQTAAIELGVVGTPSWQRFDPKSKVETVSFDLHGSNIKPATLVIKSHARGAFSLANVIQEY